MLEHAPKAGFQFVDVHGPLTWSPEAIDELDAPALRKRIEDAGLKCVGYVFSRHEYHFLSKFQR